MNAVIEAPTRARKTRTVAARYEVEATPEPSPFGFATGRHLVVDQNHLAWPETDKGDILDIDFDVHEWRGDGHYLLHHEPPVDEVVGPPGSFPFSTRWTQVQHIIRRNGHFERRVHNDSDRWRIVPEDEWARIRILARVEGIYCRRGRWDRPGVLEVGRLNCIGESDDGSAFLNLQSEPGRTVTLTGLSTEQAQTLARLLMKDVRLEVKE